MKRLFLGRNMIDVIEPKSMEPLANSLEIASFESNKISFSEYQLKNQPSPFANCSQLTSLYLNDNKISTFFSDWTSMKNLEILELQYNNISKLTVSTKTKIKNSYRL